MVPKEISWRLACVEITDVPHPFRCGPQFLWSQFSCLSQDQSRKTLMSMHSSGSQTFGFPESGKTPLSLVSMMRFSQYTRPRALGALSPAAAPTSLCQATPPGLRTKLQTHCDSHAPSLCSNACLYLTPSLETPTHLSRPGQP